MCRSAAWCGGASRREGGRVGHRIIEITARVWWPLHTRRSSRHCPTQWERLDTHTHSHTHTHTHTHTCWHTHMLTHTHNTHTHTHTHTHTRSMSASGSTIINTGMHFWGLLYVLSYFPSAIFLSVQCMMAYSAWLVTSVVHYFSRCIVGYDESTI